MSITIEKAAKKLCDAFSSPQASGFSLSASAAESESNEDSDLIKLIKRGPKVSEPDSLINRAHNMEAHIKAIELAAGVER